LADGLPFALCRFSEGWVFSSPVFDTCLLTVAVAVSFAVSFSHFETFLYALRILDGEYFFPFRYSSPWPAQSDLFVSPILPTLRQN